MEMLKIASSGLGMAPAQAMRTAEGLYTSGYLSYPRTGTTPLQHCILKPCMPSLTSLVQGL